MILLLLPLMLAQTPAEIEKLDDRWGKAIVAHDAATLEKLLADDLIYGHASGVLDTKEKYIAKIKSGKQVYATLERKNILVRILDANNAITHSWMHVTGTNQDGKFDDKVMMLHSWTKRKGSWQLIGHQTARVQVIP
jgi:ketosteroid isomerase-like protein